MRIRTWRAMAVLTIFTPLCLAAAPGNAQSTGSGGSLAAYQTRSPFARSSRIARSRPAQLSEADRAFVSRVPASRRVTVLLAGAVGQGDRLVSLVRSAGGDVERASRRAGFVIARVPAGQVTSLASAPAVDALQLGRDTARMIDNVPAQPAGHSVPAAAAERTKAAQTQELPYAPTGDVGAPQFIAQHPTFDGRGVTIALIGGLMPLDPSAPGLQLTSTGQRKIAKISDASGDHNVVTDQVVHPSGSTFTVDGVTYQLPASERARRPVRFGVLDEAKLFSTPQLPFPVDLNLDGDTTDRYPVLVTGWSRPQLRLWIDTNQDHSFADEHPLSDFNTTFPTAWPPSGMTTLAPARFRRS